MALSTVTANDVFLTNGAMHALFAGLRTGYSVTRAPVLQSRRFYFSCDTAMVKQGSAALREALL
jgi:hypothetical protein